jgi:hypothetical protein
VEADRVAGVFDLEAGLQGAEGDFAALRGNRQRRRAGEIEVSPVPEVGLEDPRSGSNLSMNACTSSFTSTSSASMSVSSLKPMRRCSPGSSS